MESELILWIVLMSVFLAWTLYYSCVRMLTNIEGVWKNDTQNFLVHFFAASCESTIISNYKVFCKTNITLKGEVLKACPLRSEMRQRCLLSQLLSTLYWSSKYCNKARKRNKRYKNYKKNKKSVIIYKWYDCINWH